MVYTDKTVLVVGLARSGMAAAKVLRHLGAKVLVNDLKKAKDLRDAVRELDSFKIEFHLGTRPDHLVEQVDFIVISPAVPIQAPFIKKAQKMGKEVISEVELAYRHCSAPIIAITGTNGKTTTTALTGEIFKASGRTTHVVGNIGIPFIGKVLDISPTDIVVAEISSFQLEAVKEFHPRVSAILNITEDHLNRHGSMENYIALKAKIFENTTKDDWVVLNADDEEVVKLASRAGAQVLLFSRRKTLKRGAWVEKGRIVVDTGEGKEDVCSAGEIFIPGPHNLENALASVAMTRVMGVPAEIIASTLKTFKGVEHRIELVDVINGITFYNDSKGTNPDASIKAVQSMKAPTVLIAGGYDKGGEFGSLIDAFGRNVTHVVVLGETADKIIKAAKEKGFDKVVRVDTLEEGVKKAFSLALPGGNVLLSPACASWDMFKDYEERGRVFKEAVRALKEATV